MNPPVLMSIDEALEKILTSAPDKPQYSSFESNIYKSLTDSHLRITARDVTAPLNIPPFPASAMDGYAVASSDNIFTEEAPYLLPLQGKSLAGNPFTKELLPNQCIRTTTGACLPDRADSIVIQENVVIKNDNIQILTKPEKLDHVREIGQDVKHKQLLFPEGTQLGPLQLGWLAACGIPEINVYRKIRMAVFSTGDELKEPGSTLKAGEIFEANRLVLEKLGNTLPVEITDLGILPDDEKQISDALKTAAKDADIILTSGGVSVGDADY
ncbi:MAG: molybdopterin molybdotransferase MoeA, partial [Pseudomonadales bacterium]|nr:molybdopterin molybdotransferase MoeA [Pseudomonadales bacterium]